MIDYAMAVAIARAEAAGLPAPPGEELVVSEADTIERPFGWVFFVQTRGFLQSRDPERQLIGVGPLLVDRRDGTAIGIDTAQHWTVRVAEYERARPEARSAARPTLEPPQPPRRGPDA